MQQYHSKIVYRLSRLIPLDLTCEIITEATDMDTAMQTSENEFYHRCPRAIMMTHTCHNYLGEQA